MVVDMDLSNPYLVPSELSMKQLSCEEFLLATVIKPHVDLIFRAE